MSNPNDSLSQKLCHYRNQDHTFNDIVIRAAHSMAYFNLIFTNMIHSWLTNTSSEKLCHKWTCTKTCYHSV